MITWGSSTNGAWKLGYEFKITAETSTYVDVLLSVYIWTRYATLDQYNTFTVTGDWAWSGNVNFNVSTNSAWSTANQAEIYHSGLRVNKIYGQRSVSFNASLTGIEYPSYNYRETVSGTFNIPALAYAAPAAVTGVTARRITDNQFSLSWTNTNPGSTTAPYEKSVVDVVPNNAAEFTIYSGPVISNLTWNNAVPDRKYIFKVWGVNRNAESPTASSVAVYTTPASCANLTAGTPRITGTNEPKTQSVDLSWSYPSGNDSSVTQYRLSWTGPTSDSKTVTTKYATVDNLIAGGIYNFAVAAQNPGDGTGMLTGPITTYTAKMLSVPTTAPVVHEVKQFLNTTFPEPRSTTAQVWWGIIPGVEWFDVVVDGVFYESTMSTFSLVQNLSAGVSHIVTIYPKTDVGRGPGTSVTIKTAGLPGPPTIKTFTPVAGGINVSLGIGYDNGSPISETQYRLTTKAGSEVIPWTRTPGMSFTITNVQSGTVYVLYVRSVNGVGTGTQIASQASDAAGGKIMVFDGTRLQPVNLTGPAGIALVRVYDGTNWVLTRNL